MNQNEWKTAVDVTANVRIGKNGACLASVERVRDADGNDRTGLFREFAAHEGFDLTNRDQIETVVGKFAEKYAGILP